jgi:cysteine-S-conjugate beta-lyase
MTERAVMPKPGFVFDDLDPAWLRSKHGVKWAMAGPDALPAWVADMDFPVAPVIASALEDVVLRGDLGYPAWSTWSGVNPLAVPFAERMDSLYGWQPDPGDVRNVSDVLQALQVLLELATRRGDSVAVQTPAYPPFLKTIQLMGRRLVRGPMEPTADGWRFSSRRLAEAVRAAECRVLMLVNPHNPTGRVLTRGELEELADIAVRNDMLIVADEVLADFVRLPHRHVPIASLDRSVADRTVTINSATKSFNMAGLRCAVMNIAPRRLRADFDAYPPDFFGPVNVLGVEATKAAWQDGGPWLDAVLDHLDTNRALLTRCVGGWSPRVRSEPPEAAYLAWLDCRELGVDVTPGDFFRTEAGVLLSAGETFGPEGQGYARLNFATSSEVLTDMLRRMERALENSPC